MMGIKYISLLGVLLSLSSLTAKSQNLGEAEGDFMEINSRSGFTNNNFMNKLWLNRKTSGSGWTSSTLVDGIAIDLSFLIPKVSARTWWERDPLTETQTWGSSNRAQLTLNGNQQGISTSMLVVSSPNNGWLLSTKANANDVGQINGIRFYSGFDNEYSKWAGVASVGEDLHSNNTGLSLYSNQTEKVRIAANGNVGIGTTNPAEKLSVNGKIRAHEIKVEITGWPDYVFGEDYKKRSLLDLEKYISDHKHLPEIPSENEVSQNGIALGDMNKLLLKKIEELTLYLIEMKKENISQQKQINELINDKK